MAHIIEVEDIGSAFPIGKTAKAYGVNLADAYVYAHGVAYDRGVLTSFPKSVNILMFDALDRIGTIFSKLPVEDGDNFTRCIRAAVQQRIDGY